MEYVNYTPCPSMVFQTIDQHDQNFHVAVIRATFDIQKDGSLLFSQNQLPLVLTDEFHGEMNESSVRQESDLAPYKPKVDVIVDATAFAPGGTPAASFPIKLRITTPPQPRPLPPKPYGLNPALPPSPAALAAWRKEVEFAQSNPIPGKTILEKTLTVHGPRLWEKKVLGGWELTQPKPLRSLPLRYEYAYGGSCRVEKDDPAAKSVEPAYRLTKEQRAEHPAGPVNAPLSHQSCEENPVGRGHLEDWYVRAVKKSHFFAPQIECPADPVRVFGRTYRPEGFGSIGKGWLPRRKYVGTVDQEWVESGKPLPDDFNFAIWNAAHPDLQLEELEGNEHVELTNLTPEGVLRFSLPGHTFLVLARYEEGLLLPVTMRLDTVFIQPDRRQVACVYRVLIPIEPAIRVLEARLHLGDDPRPLLHFLNFQEADLQVAANG